MSGAEPVVNVLAPPADIDELWLKATVESVRDQTLADWLLTVALPVPGKVDPGWLGSIYGADERIQVSGSATDPGAGGERETLARLGGEFMTVVRAGDVLARDAFAEAVALLRLTGADLVFTDEDRIDQFDARAARICKPYWSPELFTAEPYLGALVVGRRDALLDLGDPDRARELDAVHLPRCLYHRRDPGPRPVSGGDGIEVQRTEAQVSTVASSGAGAANRAAARASGDLLLFVGDGAEMPVDLAAWLERAAALAVQPGIAAVGGAIRDPAGNWLQAGLRPQLGALAPAWLDIETRPPLADRTCNPLALAGAPMLIERETFEALGQFDEERYPGSLFDIDLTLRASQQGLRNVYLPPLSVTVPPSPGSSRQEMANLISSWAEELELVSAYDRADTRPAASPAFDLGPAPVLHRGRVVSSDPMLGVTG